MQINIYIDTRQARYELSDSLITRKVIYDSRQTFISNILHDTNVSLIRKINGCLWLACVIYAANIKKKKKAVYRGCV